MKFEQLREYQALFESNLVGTDKSLSEHNTPEHSLRRGIIGEAEEALEALLLHGVESDEFKDELADLVVFFATLLNKVGMSTDELFERVEKKMTRNFFKYHPRNFEDKTVAEGMKHSRDLWE